jgi:hypothetical protein
MCPIACRAAAWQLQALAPSVLLVSSPQPCDINITYWAVVISGYLLLLTVPYNVHVRYFAVFCITSGTYTAIGVIIAWCMFFAQ